MDLFFQFKKFIQLKQVIKPFDKLLLGVSGGVDSIVLLDLFSRLKEEYKLHIVVAHLNHNLRGKNSLLDAEFVRKIALSKKLIFKCKTLRKNNFLNKIGSKSNLQEKARIARYQFFLQVAKKHQTTKILTAHQADDQVETFLMRLIRGAGTEGLKGIELVRSLEEDKNRFLIRPLLPFSREEILQYAKERELKWREDKTNLETDYFRNQVRHFIVNQMKRMNRQVVQSISNSLFILQEENKFIESYIQSISKKEISFSSKSVRVNLDWLKNLQRPIRYRMYKIILQKNLKYSRGLNRQHLDLIEKMILSKNEKAKITLPNGFVAFLDRKKMVMKKIASKNKSNQCKGFFY